MKPETDQWLRIAQGDYEFGVYGFKRGWYPQAIYMLCQALEKVLKAAQIEFANTPPRKTHRIELIAEDTGLSFSPEQLRTMTVLSQHYAKVRYPDFVRTNYNTKAKTEPIIKEAQALYLWIRKKFKNH